MSMTECARERIGNVLILHGRVRTQKDSNHTLDLLLARTAVSGNGLLDFEGGIFDELNFGVVLGGKHGGGTRMSQEHGTPHVLGEKERFHHHDPRMPLFDGFDDGGVDPPEAAHKRFGGMGSNHLRMEKARSASLGRNHPQARGNQARVDAQDDHERSSRPRMSLVKTQPGTYPT